MLIYTKLFVSEYKYTFATSAANHFSTSTPGDLGSLSVPKLTKVK
jgi:hypothetical protein